MIKNLNSPYQWRHKMVEEIVISQGDEAQLFNVLVLEHRFKSSIYTISLFHPDNSTVLAIKRDEDTNNQLYSSLDELAVAEYMPEVYQSIFYGLLTMCYCMKLSNAPQVIAFADIFEEQLVDLCMGGKQPE